MEWNAKHTDKEERTFAERLYKHTSYNTPFVFVTLLAVDSSTHSIESTRSWSFLVHSTPPPPPLQQDGEDVDISIRITDTLVHMQGHMCRMALIPLCLYVLFLTD